MATFVKFPGTAGNYVSTDDVNLLDADTAHSQQSYGIWASQTGTKDWTLAQVLPPVFGDSHFQYDAGSANPQISSGIGTGAVPVSSSTLYAFSVYAANENAKDVRLRVREYDAGGGIVATTTLQDSAMSATAWTFLSGSLTTQGATVFAAIQVTNLNGDGVVDEEYWLDAACIRAGSDGTFVPSLRIVGDLDLRASLMIPSAPAAQQIVGGTYNAGGAAAGFGFREVTAGGGRLDFIWISGVGSAFQTTSNPPFGSRFDLRGIVEQSGGAVTSGQILFDGVAQSLNRDPSGDAWPPDPNSNGLKVGIDARGLVDMWDGDLYSFEVRDGIGATAPVVARFDAEDVPVVAQLPSP